MSDHAAFRRRLDRSDLNAVLGRLGLTLDELRIIADAKRDGRLKSVSELVISSAATPKLLKDAIREYLDHELARRGCRASTQDDYRRTLEKFADFMGDVFVHQVSARHIQTFLGHGRGRISSNVGHATWNKRVSVLRPAFRWFQKKRYTTEDPFERLTDVWKPTETLVSPRVLNAIEVERLCSLASLTRYGARNRVIVELPVRAGLRLSEIVNLRQSDVFFGSNPCIWVRSGKTPRARRRVPMASQLQEVLEPYVMEYLPRRRQTLRVSEEHRDFLFYSEEGPTRGQPLGHRSVQEMVRRLVGKLGIEQGPHVWRITVHKLRHTFAVNMFLGGLSIDKLRDLLGHKSYTTTMVYLQALSDRDLRAQMDKAWTQAMEEQIRAIRRNEVIYLDHLERLDEGGI